MAVMPVITHEGFSSTSSQRCNYNAFLSFRGPDTRNNFTGHLYESLKGAGINVFMDDCELKRGEVITEALKKAIRATEILLVVFSRSYGVSRWCLDELVEIMGCSKRHRQKVLPIFYGVDPEHVRKQIGSFGEAFEQAHKDKDPMKVQSWRDALTEAANLSGWDLGNIAYGNESKFIKEIVQQVRGEIPSTYKLLVAPHPVGMNAPLQHLTYRLRVESRDDICMVGILGMAGIGKTTLAKAIYNRFFEEFQGNISLLDVRERTKQQNGMVCLQNQLLEDILKPNKFNVGLVDRGKEVIKQRLQYMRVLVIIDDVVDEDQLNALAGNCDWFGPGSRIIITTRYEHLLRKRAKDSIYRVQSMHKVESLQLFCWHAFRDSCYPKEGYVELSDMAVSYCSGVPLVLEVIGSSLFGKDAHQWKSHLEKMKRIPPGNIVEKLKLCYDGLSERDRVKDIFLDIACFFVGMHRNCVIEILDACGFDAGSGIDVLLDRCLVTLSDTKELMMHDLLKDMGREIVCEKYRDEPEKRSRIWHPTDVEEVLTKTSGTEEIEGLSAKNFEVMKSFSTEAFTNMKRLRLLQLDNVNLTGDYGNLPKRKLRWLCWHGFPLMVIPREFDLRSLVIIDLRYSKLTKVWDDPQPQYSLEKLKILNLGHSHDLMKSPDFSRLPNLEQLILEDCKSLCEVHQSIGDLQRLSLVNLKDCKMLKCLPKSFDRLKFTLETLDLSGTNLAGSFSEMVPSGTLLADEGHETAIRNIPSSIVRREGSSFSRLKGLNLSNCNLTDDSVLVNLRGLSLDYLHLEGNGFHRLNNLGGLEVKMLFSGGCNNLLSITELPKKLISLFLAGCSSLEMVPDVSYELSVGSLNIWYCPKVIKFPGLVDWVQIMPVISIQGHLDSIPSPLKTAIVQEWLMIDGDGIYFRGNKIPSWCSHVNYRGRPVNFEMPSGRDIAFCVCFVFSRSQGKFDYDANRNGFVVVNHTRKTGFFVHQFLVDFLTTNCNKKYLFLRNMLLQDILNLEAGDSISLLVVLGDYYKVHQIGVQLIEDHEPFLCYAAEDLKSISYEEAKDLLSDNDIGDNINDDEDDDETNDGVDDDDTTDTVEEAGASYSVFDADNGIVGDYSEDHEEGETHDPVDEDQPTKRLRRSDPSIVTVSMHEVGFTPSPPRAHFDPTQIASSSQAGGPENVALQQQMLIQQLLSENEELRRQLILLQQPNPILVERNFLQLLEDQMRSQEGSPSLTAEAANAHNGLDSVLMDVDRINHCISHVDDRDL